MKYSLACTECNWERKHVSDSAWKSGRKHEESNPGHSVQMFREYKEDES